MKINKNFLRGFMNKTFKAARKVAMIGSIVLTMMLGVYMPVYATSGVSTLNNYLLDIYTRRNTFEIDLIKRLWMRKSSRRGLNNTIVVDGLDRHFGYSIVL